MTTPALSLGRSDPDAVRGSRPTDPAADGVDVGLGDSNKLSRLHARISWDAAAKTYVISCVGKNGLSVTAAGSGRTVVMTPAAAPVGLETRSLVQMGDALFVFLLPVRKPGEDDVKEVMERKKSAKPVREWIKAEHNALRSWMMRFGYGRWKDVVATSSGRLGEREPAELIPVARRFVAQCYCHASAGVERKVLFDVLMEDAAGRSENDKESGVQALIADAEQVMIPTENRKYVRWARKLRLLKRLKDVVEHESVDQLREGELRVFTPPPAPWWTSADDADFLIGTHRHGYGSVEAVRLDEELGFATRTKPSLHFSQKGGAKDDDKEGGTPVSVRGDGDDGYEDEDGEDGDEDGGDGDGSSSARKAGELISNEGARMAKKKKRERDGEEGEDDADGAGSNNDDSEGGGGSSTGLKEEDKERVKMEDTPVKQEGNGSSPPSAACTPSSAPRRNGKFVKKGGANAKSNDDAGGPALSPSTLLDGNNTPASAANAHAALSDADSLVAFPPTEALMRRLKSIINSCAKVYDRDVKEKKKREAIVERAQRRKEDLAAKKLDKEQEKKRLAEERRKEKCQPFSKKDAIEFERALVNFGCDYKPRQASAPGGSDGSGMLESDSAPLGVDWSWFVSKAPSFQSKYTETLDVAFKDIMSEALRITELAAAQEDDDPDQVERARAAEPSSMFSTLTLERAERLMERVEFFRYLRVEILTHSRISQVIRGYKRPKELPMWWRSLHDRALLLGVDRHGLNAWENVEYDDELSFASSKKSFMRKYADDPKALKRGAFPKPSVATKHAQGLIGYFRARVNDPLLANDFAPSGAGDDAKAGGPSNGSSSGHKRKRESFGSGSSAAEEVVQIITDSRGHVQLPADLGGGLVVMSLGDVVPNGPSSFCSKHTLYPVGYRAVVQDDEGRYYLAEVLTTQDVEFPVFRARLLKGVKLEPGAVVTWQSSDESVEDVDIGIAWSQVSGNSGNGRVSAAELGRIGATRFGLCNPTVLYHLQRQPAARCFADGPFEWRDFSKQGGEEADAQAYAGVQDTLIRALDRHLGRNVNSPWNASFVEFSTSEGWTDAYSRKKRRRSGPPAS